MSREVWRPEVGQRVDWSCRPVARWRGDGPATPVAQTANFQASPRTQNEAKGKSKATGMQITVPRLQACKHYAKWSLELAGATTQSLADRQKRLQVSRRSRRRLTWQSDHRTLTTEFATWAKPKMSKGIREAQQRSQEPNHTLGVENGGPRWSTHLLHMLPPELAALQP